MSRRKSANKPRGRPFQPGPDSRRNKGGNLNHEAQSYEIRFRNALAAKLSPLEFARIIIQEVRAHRPGAREFYADRLMGKVTQPITGQVQATLAFKFGENGNGNSEAHE